MSRVVSISRQGSSLRLTVRDTETRQVRSTAWLVATTLPPRLQREYENQLNFMLDSLHAARLVIRRRGSA